MLCTLTLIYNYYLHRLIKPDGCQSTLLIKLKIMLLAKPQQQFKLTLTDNLCDVKFTTKIAAI